MWQIESVRRCGLLKDVVCKQQVCKWMEMILDMDIVKVFMWWQSVVRRSVQTQFLIFLNPCDSRNNGNNNAALRKLKEAREVPVLGSKALLLMIDISVNPTGGVLGDDAMENGNIGDAMAKGLGADKESLKYTERRYSRP